MAITNNYNNRKNNGSNSNGSNVNFIDSSSPSNNDALHPPLYCRICDVLMMFMLSGKFVNKYFCGMCGMTEDPEESEFYAKHKDELRSLDDDDDSGGGNGIRKYRYEDMIVQSKGDHSPSFSQASERQVRMTSQRQRMQSSSTSTHRVSQEDNDDWTSMELKRDLEANGMRQVVRIMDIDNNANTINNNKGKYNSSRINKIERPG